MAFIKFDARQVIDRDLLTRITGASGSQTDTIIAALNSEITPPLALSVTGANRVVTIGNITVFNPSTNLNRTVPPISNLLPTFSSGTVTISASGAGNATPSVGTVLALAMVASGFMRIGVSIDPLGSLTLTKGTQAATLAAATTPAVPSGLFGIGQIIVRTDGSNNVANVLTSDLYQYVGGGGGSGSGDASSILETLKNELVDSSYQNVTPSIAAQQAGTLVSSFGGTGSYSIADQTYLFPVIADSLTSVQMIDEEEFINNNPTDITKSLAYLAWRSGYIDPLATVQISRNGGTNYYPVTMSRVGANTEAFSGEYEWTREEEDDLQFIVDGTAGGANIELTNVAGVLESAAIKKTLSVNQGVQVRVEYLTVVIRKVGAPAGNWRVALFTNAGGVPSSRIATGAWNSAASLTTGYVGLATYFTNSNLYVDDNTSYHIVVETDSAYKASYVASTTSIQLERTTSGTDTTALDGVTWSTLASSTMRSVLGYYYERFTSLSTDVTATTAEDQLKAGTQQEIGSQFTVATGTAIALKKAMLRLKRTGTVSGNIFYKVVKDSAGVPSALSSDIVAVSRLVDVSTISTSNEDRSILFGTTVIGPGTYHIVLASDATYKASYSVGVSYIGIQRYTGAASGLSALFNGTTWSEHTSTFHYAFTLSGRPLDLRLKITSGTVLTQLAAFASFYEIGTPIAGGRKNFDKKVFKSATDNLNSFSLNFVPDPDLLRVYRIGTGQVFKYPDFTFSGSTITFPVNTFYDVADIDVELHLIQTEGSSFDNSDRNGLLLASNFLGSTDSSLDRSQAGRGIFLRRPDGTLREIGIDDFDNIIVYSV